MKLSNDWVSILLEKWPALTQKRAVREQHGDWISKLLRKWPYRRTSNGAIAVAKELNLSPKTIIDCGANLGWVTKRWALAWPEAKLISIEPNPNFHPPGELIRVALSDHDDEGWLVDLGSDSYLGSEKDGRGSPVHIRRFDSLSLSYPKPAIVKVDCEDSTYAALVGIGNCLNDFAAIHVEMWNHKAIPEFKNLQSEIHAFMWESGFKHHKTMDAEVGICDVVCTDVLFWR